MEFKEKETRPELSIPSFPLGSTGDQRIPLLGFGTAEFPFGASNDTLKHTIIEAIRLGHRHFDTAAIYQTEQPLGEAVADALRPGLIKSRDELFITSKFWCSDAHCDRVVPASGKRSRGGHCSSGSKLCMGSNGGVSKSWPNQIYRSKQFIMQEAPDHPFHCQNRTFSEPSGDEPCVATKETERLLQGERHTCAGLLSFGGKGTAWGSDRVIESEILKDIAQAKRKSPAQVCLRWVYEQGVCVIVKSFNKERMKQNLDIFDWELSDDDLHKISQFPQCKGYAAEHFLSDYGPYRSVQEFWDGEI
ncbi:hypothetical protein F3Y22_tig00110327pilonHSYRG00038 [Hibiscus syriacus]|uniref:NADP-dependent oxidoreductase domain-containing protein n=1 Tax=Hibiscus syriacus TaxID=106335 RepID=A0A6A3B3A2_HIBSY|nr:hypothetical protein F3Y22_tig00110327pilonHSYRG00038 [Hibiscus syriacus]